MCHTIYGFPLKVWTKKKYGFIFVMDNLVGNEKLFSFPQQNNVEKKRKIGILLSKIKFWFKVWEGFSLVEIFVTLQVNVFQVQFFISS